MTLRRYQQISGITISMMSDVTDNLQKFTPHFYDAFFERYSGEN